MTDTCLHTNVVAPSILPNLISMDLEPMVDKAAPIPVASGLQTLTLLPISYFCENETSNALIAFLAPQ